MPIYMVERRCTLSVIYSSSPGVLELSTVTPTHAELRARTLPCWLNVGYGSGRRHDVGMDDLEAQEPRLVWSEVLDMMSISPGIHSVDELIAALDRYRDDPPEPEPPRRGMRGR